MPRLLQPAFTRGEVSPQLHGRVDLALYQIALRTLRNMMVRPQGGAFNRGGTQFVAPCRHADSASVLIPFIFSTEQAYILEFSEGSIRVFANGAFVEDIGVSNPIDGINVGAGPTFTRTVSFTDPHGLVTDDQVTIFGVKGTGSYNINGTWTVVSTPTVRIIEIASPLADKGQYFIGGDMSQAIDLVTPYVEAELADLRFAQSADVLTVTHKDHPQYEFRRLSSNNFEFVPAVFDSGPFLDDNLEFSIQIHASAAFGEVALTSTADVFELDHEGVLLRLSSRNLSAVMPWESGQVLANQTENVLGILRRSDGKVYKCVTDFTPAAGDQARSGSFRPVHEFGVQSDGSGKIVSADVTREGVAWEYVHSGFGVVRITNVASPTSATATVLRRLPADVVGGPVAAATYGPFAGDGVTKVFSIAGAADFSKYAYEVTLDGVLIKPDLYEVDATLDTVTFYDAPATAVVISVDELTSNNRTDIWALGAWGEHKGYPSLVSYFQDRIFYAASRDQPQTLWASKVASYKDFGVSSPIQDDDALNFTQNSRQINALRELLPLDKLVTLSASGAFKVTDGQDEVLTPTTVGFKPQSFRGAKRIRAVLVGDEAVFVHDAGRELRTLGYKFEVDKFTGVDLSVMANHLLTKTKTVADMDYAEEPHSVIHVVRTDGQLLHLTYDPEQEVTAWSHSDTADGLFERVCVIPEDSDSAVYFVVNRTVNGQTSRHIERLSDREVDDPLYDGVFVDCALSFDGRNTGTKTMRLTGADFSQDELLTLTASGSTFDSDLPPDQVWLELTDEDDVTHRVRVVFEAYTSPTVITVRPISDVPTALQAVATTTWSLAYDTFSGLNHLEGATVTATVDGTALDDQVITGGTLELDSPAAVVHVGLRITCDMEPLEINIANSETVRDLAKHIGAVTVVVLQSRDIQVGPDADHLDDIPTREESDDYDASALVDGAQKLYIASTLSTEGRFFLRHDEPLPLNVLAFIPKVQLGTDG